MRTLCSEPGCDKSVHGHGLCSTHYERQRRRHKSGCSECGGPKPVGQGIKLCDECRPKVEERNRQKLAEYQRQRYLRDRDKVLARSRERSKDPEYRAQKARSTREWARKHPDRARATQRRAWAKRKYGITLEEADAILARGCAICGAEHGGRIVGRASALMPTRPEQRLCLDHCHTTGKVRAALCHGCNSALGLMSDDPARLRAAADYLEKHRTEVAA
jgi:predicted  nucleic acid-binding Zn-ribbon protein